MRIKKSVLGLALAIGLAVGCIPTTAEASFGRKAIDVVNSAKNNTGYIGGRYGSSWCATYVCDRMNVSSYYYSGSVSELTSRCINRASNRLGDFYLVADNKDDWSYKGNSASDLNNYGYYDPNYVPAVGDIVVYEANDWVYDYQREWVNYACDGPDHMGIVTEVSGYGKSLRIKTIEGCYTELNTKPSDYNTYFDYIMAYYNASIAKSPTNKPAKEVSANDVRYWQIYGYIRPYYADYKPVPQKVPGDVDDNGTINMADLTMLKKYILNDCKLTSEQMRNADMNSDGKVNAIDMTLLKRKLMGN